MTYRCDMIYGQVQDLRSCGPIYYLYLYIYLEVDCSSYSILSVIRD